VAAKARGLGMTQARKTLCHVPPARLGRAPGDQDAERQEGERAQIVAAEERGCDPRVSAMRVSTDRLRCAH
jgi:hypothetical protein